MEILLRADSVAKRHKQAFAFINNVNRHMARSNQGWMVSQRRGQMVLHADDGGEQ